MSHNPQFISDNHYPVAAVDYFTKGYSVVDTTWNRLSLMIKQGELSGVERARLLLNSGLDAFRMDIACLTRLDDECLTIVFSNNPQWQQKQFKRHQSLCQFTIEQGDIVASTDLAKTNLDDYGVVESLKFASYIGIPVYIKKRLYGTLFFASYEARIENFTARDEAFLKIMASSFPGIIRQHLSA